MASTAGLPDELRERGERWLLDLERRVVAIQAGANQLSEAEALMLITAIGDVLDTLQHARGVFVGDVPLGQRPSSRWVPVTRPSRTLAALVHSAGADLGETPLELIRVAKSELSEERCAAVLLTIGDVLGSVFTNLTRAVWDSHPEFAPSGWSSAN
jgi:hypothetical protein